MYEILQQARVVKWMQLNLRLRAHTIYFQTGKLEMLELIREDLQPLMGKFLLKFHDSNFWTFEKDHVCVLKSNNSCMGMKTSCGSLKYIEQHFR